MRFFNWGRLSATRREFLESGMYPLLMLFYEVGEWNRPTGEHQAATAQISGDSSRALKKHAAIYIT
jgi:hypothetical protein